MYILNFKQIDITFKYRVIPKKPNVKQSHVYSSRYFEEMAAAVSFQVLQTLIT